MKNFKQKLAATTLAATIAFSGIGLVNPLQADAARSGFDQSKVGGTVVLTSFADAVRLIPFTTSDSASNDIQGLIFDALLSQDINGAPIPNLAEKYTFDKAKNTYTFTLRKGVKFHDGKPMTAKDVVFSYKMYMDPKSINSYKGDFESIESVTANGDHTVVIKLKEKDVLFLTNVVTGAAVLASHQFPKGVADYNSNNKVHRNPIGTGPFKFKEWKAAERIVVVANKEYWNGRPYLDQVITRILPDSNVEAINLLKGSVDFVEALDAAQLPQVSKNKALKTISYDYGRFDFLGFNSKVAPFNDEKVRKALALGLDRQSIVSKVQLGRAYLASGPMHPKIPQNNPNVKALPFDIKQAAKLLDEAGWTLKDGVRQKGGTKMEFEFAYNNGNKVREKIALLAQQNWAQLGIKVTPRSYEWSIFLDKYAKGELDIFPLGWGGYDANVEHSGFFHSSNIPDPAKNKPGNNRNRIDDPTIDKILDQYKQEEDRNKRIKMYQDLHKHMADNTTLIFTYHPKLTAGVNKDLANIKMSISDPYFNIVDWYWSSAKKRKGN
ncbi:hypothetical protein IMZ08_03665 [Bacillus luteolus]|uniref:Solute-binding protein family 5 domain-containing protein n=1 Tax=Litchfieldia luteola TaxID=682179 RepID=A0ABR9QFG3_9BACI|nr:ABC transporter substrate-binding protein [Cytobacillus luteolus]MBE4907156.1 hypothetical protein [Cytobacillus luteolus]MBP1943374.1 peptide/nickel transport system substrate-binding protein [Cytobacillus luteolus]